MEFSLAVAISFLLIGLSRSHIIPSHIQNESEQIVIKPNSNNDTLIFAHVIYRHGDRSMDGSMQINNEGKRQLFLSGEYFRRRYNDLIGGKYSPEKVFVLSTDYDRAIMSAESNLAGMFPPQTEEEIWKNDIKWQPIPVHTIPNESDNLLHGGKKCAKFGPLVQYYRDNNPEIQAIYAKYGHLFPYWAKMKGMRITTVEDVAFLYKKLMTDVAERRPLPDWAKEELKTIDYIANVNYKFRGTPQLVRIRSGFLIKDILERFTQKMNGTLEPDLTLFMYSAHSSTISTLLNGLNAAGMHVPPHGSSLHFEMYKTNGNQYYLQLFYRKPDEEYPAPLKLKCGEKWSLEQFSSMYQAIIPGDFDSECRL